LIAHWGDVGVGHVIVVVVVVLLLLGLGVVNLAVLVGRHVDISIAGICELLHFECLLYQDIFNII